MKVKVKFDLASIKSWLFEHGEKLVFGIMVFVFLMMIYSATQREVLDASKEPDKLRSLADNVTQHVAQSEWNPKNPDVQLVDYQSRTTRAQIPLKNYVVTTPFDRPLAEAKGRREDPEIFNVEETHIAAGMAPFSLKLQAPAAATKDSPRGARGTRGFAPSADAKLKPQPWAVITALVPVEKQSVEYVRVFSQAQGENPERDTPHYADVSVERAEIDPETPGKLEWKPVAPIATFEKQWEGTMPEIVDKRFVEPNLVDPLGPRVGEEWDAVNATHPKIPLIGEASAVSSAATAQQPGASAASGSDADGPAAKPAAAPAESFGRRRGAPETPAAQASTPSTPETPERITYKLMRIFDFSVEPNKQYRYRVKVGLENPNHGLHPRLLKNPGAPENQQAIRMAKDWVETPTVTVPAGYGVLAGAIESSRDPFAKILLTAIKDDGVVATTEARVQRGSVANKRDRVEAIDPRNGSKQPAAEVDFKTRMVVLDIHGGKAVSTAKRRSKPIFAPGEVLLLDSAGNLVVHGDLEDAGEYAYRNPPPAEEVDDKDKKSDSKKSEDDAPKGKASRSTAKAGR